MAELVLPSCPSPSEVIAAIALYRPGPMQFIDVTGNSRAPSHPNQSHVFEDDLTEGLRAAKAFQRVQNLDAGQPPCGVIVGSDILGRQFTLFLLLRR